MTLLSVENLRVSFPTRQGLFEAVRGVSFDLGRERLGVVGESGSGKSMTGRAILGLVRPPGQVSADRMQLDGQSILNLSERRMRRIRGSRISMVMQDPKFSLNPVMTVGDQIIEAYRLHAGAPGPRPAARRWKCCRRSRSATPNGSWKPGRTRSRAAWASAS